MKKRAQRALVFEFTTFRQIEPTIFAFNYEVYFVDGTIEKFSERLRLPFAVKAIDRTTRRIFEQMHIALGINYYKLYAPHTVKVPYEFDTTMANFWNKVYRYGLGEFAYKNGLSPQSLGNFRATKPTASAPERSRMKFDINGRYLTGIGGGKDSLVAWELLKRLGIKQTPFVTESPSHNNSLRREVLRVLEVPPLIVERSPDKKLETLRASGSVYRGHTPMSVVVAFAAVLCAHVKKYDGFLVANESSSNEYNLTWRGIKVNHQWTKTAAFEKAMNALLADLDVQVNYLSVVRPMNELMITSLFAKMSAYHQAFFSCNKSQLDKLGKPVKWCGMCAKCASASLLLAPFLSPKQLSKIIGVNMFNNMDNLQLFAELAGFAGNKPFECVCTKEEAQAIIRHLYHDPRYGKSPVIQGLFEQYDDSEKARGIEELLKFRAQKSFPTTLAHRLNNETQKILTEGI